MRKKIEEFDEKEKNQKCMVRNILCAAHDNALLFALSTTHKVVASRHGGIDGKVRGQRKDEALCVSVEHVLFCFPPGIRRIAAKDVALRVFDKRERRAVVRGHFSMKRGQRRSVLGRREHELPVTVIHQMPEIRSKLCVSLQRDMQTKSLC